jgi:hypothetical protein
VLTCDDLWEKSGVLRIFNTVTGVSKKHAVCRDAEEARRVQVLLIDPKFVLLVYSQSVLVLRRLDGALELQKRGTSIQLPKETPTNLQARHCRLLKNDRLLLSGSFSYCFCEAHVSETTHTWESAECVQSGKTESASSSIMRVDNSANAVAIVSRGMCAVWSLEPAVRRMAAISIDENAPVVTALAMTTDFLVMGYSDGSVGVRSTRTGHFLLTLQEAPPVSATSAKDRTEKESSQFALTGVDLKGKVNVIRVAGKFCCVGYQTGLVRLFMLNSRGAADDAATSVLPLRTNMCHSTYRTSPRDSVRRVTGIVLCEEKLRPAPVLALIMVSGKVFALVENKLKKKQPKPATGLIRSLTRSSGGKSNQVHFHSSLYCWNPRFSKHEDQRDFGSATQRVAVGDFVSIDEPSAAVESKFDNLALWDESPSASDAPEDSAKVAAPTAPSAIQKTLDWGTFGAVSRLLCSPASFPTDVVVSHHFTRRTGPNEFKNRLVLWHVGGEHKTENFEDITIPDPSFENTDAAEFHWTANGALCVVYDQKIHVMKCDTPGRFTWVTAPDDEAAPMTCRDRVTCSMVRETEAGPQLFAFLLSGLCEVWDLGLEAGFLRVAEIECHAGPVTAAAYHSDYMVTGGEDALLKVFALDLEDLGKCHKVFAGHKAPVTSVALLRRQEDFTDYVFSVAGGDSTSGSDGGFEVKCWDRNAGVLLRTVVLRDGVVPFLSQVFPGDELLMLRDGADAGLSAVSWGLWPGRAKQLQRLQGHVARISGMGLCDTTAGDALQPFCPLVSFADDTTVRLWNIREAGSIVRPIVSHGTGLLYLSSLVVGRPKVSKQYRSFKAWVGSEDGSLAEIEFRVPHAVWSTADQSDASDALPGDALARRLTLQTRVEQSIAILPPIPVTYRASSGAPKPLPRPPEDFSESSGAHDSWGSDPHSSWGSDPQDDDEGDDSDLLDLVLALEEVRALPVPMSHMRSPSVEVPLTDTAVAHDKSPSSEEFFFEEPVAVGHGPSGLSSGHLESVVRTADAEQSDKDARGSAHIPVESVSVEAGPSSAPSLVVSESARVARVVGATGGEEESIPEPSSHEARGGLKEKREPPSLPPKLPPKLPSKSATQLGVSDSAEVLREEGKRVPPSAPTAPIGFIVAPSIAPQPQRGLPAAPKKSLPPPPKRSS